MKRTFIAVKLVIEAQTERLIHTIKNDLRNESVKWVDLGNMHSTLRFLGDIEEDLIDQIGDRLAENLKSFDAFNLKCKGLGVFKNVYHPKVIWLGIEKSDELIEVKHAVDQALQPIGFPEEERAFRPHLTLGRVKHIKDKAKLKHLLDKYRDKENQSFTIDSVIFYESVLTREGPVYKVLRKFEFN